jgi:hypothetical protein
MLCQASDVVPGLQSKNTRSSTSHIYPVLSHQKKKERQIVSSMGIYCIAAKSEIGQETFSMIAFVVLFVCFRFLPSEVIEKQCMYPGVQVQL